MSDVSSQAGFSLLEALVATAITALAVIPLLSLQQANLSLARTAQEKSEQASIDQSVLSLMKTLNISELRDGRMPIGRFEVRWTSEEISTQSPSLGRSGDMGRFVSQLFQVTASIIDNVSGDTRTVSFVTVGYRALRSPAQLGLPPSPQ